HRLEAALGQERAADGWLTRLDQHETGLEPLVTPYAHLQALDRAVLLRIAEPAVHLTQKRCAVRTRIGRVVVVLERPSRSRPQRTAQQEAEYSDGSAARSARPRCIGDDQPASGCSTVIIQRATPFRRRAPYWSFPASAYG